MVSKNNILPWDTLNFYYATYLRKKKKNSLVFPTRMYQRISTLVSFIQWRSTNLINKRYGSLTMQQMIWLWNHTSYRKFNFNEFVANVLRDNMGMIIFDLWGCGGCYRPKTSYLGAHFGTSTQFGSSLSNTSAYRRFTKKSYKLWISASIQPIYLEKNHTQSWSVQAKRDPILHRIWD